MKLLFDEMMPEESAPLLIGHEVQHVIDLGWRHLTNAKLLTMAEVNGIEVFVTKDANLPYQQDIEGRTIAIVILRPKAQSLPALLNLAPALLDALSNSRPGGVTVLSTAD